MRIIFCLCLSTILHAQITLDDFSTTQGPVSQTGIGSNTDMATGSGILGMERTVRVTMGGTGTATANVSGNQFAFTADDSADCEIWWDGGGGAFDTTGLGGVDLTAGGQNSIQIQVVSNDQTSNNMALDVYTDGGNRSTIIFTMPASGNVDLAFASFSVSSGAGADFSNVGLIHFRNVDRPASWNFTLGFSGTTPVELTSISVE